MGTIRYSSTTVRRNRAIAHSRCWPRARPTFRAACLAAAAVRWTQEPWTQEPWTRVPRARALACRTKYAAMATAKRLPRPTAKKETEMRRGFISSSLVCVLLAGCGSSNPNPGSRPDALPPPPDAAPMGTQDTPDAGCDEDAMGANLYIINCLPGGGGTHVMRLPPPATPTCAL